MGSCSLLQGIFLTHWLNSGLLNCRRILYQLSHKGSTRILEWVAYPFSSRSFDPGIKQGSPALQVDSLPTELWEIPGGKGKFGLGVQNEGGQRLREFCQENSLVIVNTFFQQHKRRLYTWPSPDGQYQNQIHHILCSQRWKSSIQLAKSRLVGADCGSDHELLIAKFRLKLKKVGKTTRPFRYNPNQIPTIIQWEWEIDLRD